MLILFSRALLIHHKTFNSFIPTQHLQIPVIAVFFQPIVKDNDDLMIMCSADTISLFFCNHHNKIFYLIG